MYLGCLAHGRSGETCLLGVAAADLDCAIVIPRFPIDEPIVANLITIRIIRAGCAESHGFGGLYGQVHNGLALVIIESSHRIMIGLLECFGYAPIHPGRKVMLKGLSPSPDCRLGGTVFHAVLGDDRVHATSCVCPDGLRLGVRLTEDIASAPAPVRRTLAAAQSVADKTKKRGCVALHDVFQFRIERPERTMVLDYVFLQPWIVDKLEFVERPVLVMAVAGNPRPCSFVVFMVTHLAGGDNVKEIRECQPHPASRVVLIGDRIDSELGDELGELLLAPGVLHVPKRLSQTVGPAPDTDPDRAVIRLIDDLYYMARALRTLAFSDSCHAEFGRAGLGYAQQMLLRRISGRVLEQVAMDLAIRFDPLADVLGTNLVPEPNLRRGDQAFDIEFVRVDQKANHRLLIIRLVGNIGQHNHSRLIKLLKADRLLGKACLRQCYRCEQAEQAFRKNGFFVCSWHSVLLFDYFSELRISSWAPLLRSKR